MSRQLKHNKYLNIIFRIKTLILNRLDLAFTINIIIQITQNYSKAGTRFNPELNTVQRKTREFFPCCNRSTGSDTAEPTGRPVAARPEKFWFFSSSSNQNQIIPNLHFQNSSIYQIQHIQHII